MSTTYEVPGISCNHCRDTIEAGLRQLDGVAQVAVDIAGKTVRVDGTAPDGDIRGALQQLGYPTA